MEQQTSETLTRLRLTLAYDGTDFFGWQKQPNEKQPSVQGLLEKSLSQIYQRPIRVIGSGRTDRGVHARAQVAHFDVPGDASRMELKHKLQSMTPPTVSILKVETAPERFHAQLWVQEKTYKYYILNRPEPDPFKARYCLHYPWKINAEFLNEACQYLLGPHDFKSFQSTGTPVPDTERILYEANWVRDPETQFLTFTIRGNGFLKQMVRNIVGTLIDIERTCRPSKALKEILEARDRRKAGTTAAAHGLFLDHVDYGVDREPLFIEIPSRFQTS